MENTVFGKLLQSVTELLTAKTGPSAKRSKVHQDSGYDSCGSQPSNSQQSCSQQSNSGTLRKSVRRSKSLEDPEQIFISLHKNSSNCKVNLAYITENLPKQEEFALLVKDHIDVDKTLFKVTVKSREEYEFDEEHEIPFYHSIEDYKADPMLFKVFANVFLVEILKQISEKRVDDFKDSITQSVQLLLEEFPKVQFTCRCEGDEKPVFFSNAQDISTTVKSAAELADAMNGINVLRQGTKFALNHSTFARNTFFKNILRVTEPNYDLSNIKQTKK